MTHIAISLFDPHASAKINGFSPELKVAGENPSLPEILGAAKEWLEKLSSPENNGDNAPVVHLFGESEPSPFSLPWIGQLTSALDQVIGLLANPQTKDQELPKTSLLINMNPEVILSDVPRDFYQFIQKTYSTIKDNWSAFSGSDTLGRLNDVLRKDRITREERQSINKSHVEALRRAEKQNNGGVNLKEYFHMLEKILQNQVNGNKTRPRSPRLQQQEQGPMFHTLPQAADNCNLRNVLRIVKDLNELLIDQ